MRTIKNFEVLIRLLTEYDAYRRSSDYHEDNDWAHYIFEEACKAVLGPDIFKDWNHLNDDNGN